MSDTALMQNYTREVAWQNFFASEMTRWAIEEKRRDSVLERTKAFELLSQDTKTVTEAKALRDTSENVQRAQDALVDAWAKRKSFEMAYESRERCAALYSRELTRRTGGSTPERRASRWGA